MLIKSTTMFFFNYLYYLIFTDNIMVNIISVIFIDTTDDEEETFELFEVKISVTTCISFSYHDI